LSEDQKIAEIVATNTGRRMKYFSITAEQAKNLLIQWKK
jgi:hypothetical protein